jgi:hypothetical protein
LKLLRKQNIKQSNTSSKVVVTFNAMKDLIEGSQKSGAGWAPVTISWLQVMTKQIALLFLLSLTLNILAKSQVPGRQLQVSNGPEQYVPELIIP